MDIQKVKELALANGFKLKEQASGNMNLNAYVYDFANAVEREAKAQAVPDLGELQERIAGHQYYHDEHGHMVVDMDDVVKEISGFDSWKAQAVPEGFVLVSAEKMSQWGHMANYAEQYGCPECFEARGYAHSLACEINAYFNVSDAQEQNQ